MQLYEIYSVEARRNPDQNPKIAGRVEAAKFLANVLSNGENWGASFTEINKLGINPRTDYNSGFANAGTPAGVYFYPAKYFINTVRDNLPFTFGDKREFIQVFSYESKNMLVMNTATLDDFLRVTKILGVEAESEIGYGASIMATIDRYVQENPSKTSETWEIHRILRKLGYDALLDLGTGSIQGNEPYCGVILDTSIIKQRKTFNNIQPKDKKDPTVKAVDDWQKEKPNQPEPRQDLEPEEAFEYARDVIHGRWYAAEPIIAQDPYVAEKYADLFIGYGDAYDKWIDSLS